MSTENAESNACEDSSVISRDSSLYTQEDGLEGKRRRPVGSLSARIRDTIKLIDDEYTTDVQEEDRRLPISNIATIMKTTLPPKAKVALKAKELVGEIITEFISLVSSEALDQCKLENRKTINGDDLLLAMSTLGFDKHVELLEDYLRKYRVFDAKEKNSRNQIRIRKQLREEGSEINTQPDKQES